MTDDERQRPKYPISVVAEMVGVHPQTLRLYEREGLLKPQRTSRQTRLYSEEDIERLRSIISLTQDMGVNLAGVEVILGLLEKMQRMQEEMDVEVDRMRREMEELLRRAGK